MNIAPTKQNKVFRPSSVYTFSAPEANQIIAELMSIINWAGLIPSTDPEAPQMVEALTAMLYSRTEGEALAGLVSVLEGKQVLIYDGVSYSYLNLKNLNNTTQSLVEESAVDRKIAAAVQGTLHFTGYCQIAEPASPKENQLWIEGTELPVVFPATVKKYVSGSWVSDSYAPSSFDLWTFSDNTGYYWMNGWVLLDFGIDLTNYYTKTEIDSLLSPLVSDVENDGNVYARSNGQWVKLILGQTLDWANRVAFVNGTAAPFDCIAFVGMPQMDSNHYLYLTPKDGTTFQLVYGGYSNDGPDSVSIHLNKGDKLSSSVLSGINGWWVPIIGGASAESGGSGGGTAATTSFEPTATITSENVQDAIEEVDAKAEAVAGALENIAATKADLNKVFPVISDLGNLSGAEINVLAEACYKGVANGSFKLILPIPTDGRTHSFRIFAKAETNANITFNKKIMYDSSITDYGDLISGTYYDYIFTWQPILSKWQMFRKEYKTEPSTLQLLLRFNGNLQDSSPTNLSAAWTALDTSPGVEFDTANYKFSYTASAQKRDEGIRSANSEAAKLKAIINAIKTGDFTVGVWVYCPTADSSPAMPLWRWVKNDGYVQVCRPFEIGIGWSPQTSSGDYISLGYYQDWGVGYIHGWVSWTQGWHYVEMNRKDGVAYLFFDGVLTASGAFAYDVSTGVDDLAYLDLFGWNASGSLAHSWQELVILSKASHIADFTPPSAPFVVEED